MSLRRCHTARPVIRSSVLLLRLTVALLLTFGGIASADVEFDTVGGDAWDFERYIGGRADSACEAVIVRSRAGSVSAWTDGQRFEALVPLREGNNSVRAECLGADASVVDSVTEKWQVRVADRPKAWIRMRVRDGAVWLDAGASERARGEPAPLKHFEWRASESNPAPLRLAAVDRTLDERPAATPQLRLEPPEVDGDYHVTLRVSDARQRTDESTIAFRVVDGRPVKLDPAHDAPQWVDEAVIYGAVPYFFADAGLEELIARLDHIAALGATVIWLAPVTDAPTHDFGYAVRDHFRVREHLGGDEGLRALIAAAHERGLRVLLDFVPNHLADEHRYHLDAARSGPRSPYHDWFEREPDGEIAYYFDWDNLKNLNYDNPEVQRYIIEAGAYWVREFGIDGFRVDASWAVANRAPEFWPRWREELKRINPDLLLLAEASPHEPYHLANGFDAVYDWTERLGQWAWHDVFDGTTVDLDRLRAAIAQDGESADATLRFLNNNDTGPRFISRHGVDLKKLAAALKFTLPGIPLIYNGDEIGAEFEPYSERPPLDWSDPHNLSDYYSRLADLRRELPALRGATAQVLETDRDESVLAYVRPGGQGDEDVLLALNFGDRPVEVCLTDSAAVSRLSLAVIEYDALSDARIYRGDDRAPVLRMPAHGIVIARLSD